MVSPRTMLRPTVLACALLVLWSSVSSCKSQRSGGEKAAPDPGASAQVGASAGVGNATPLASSSASSARKIPKAPVYHIPVGPMFGIEPGVGIGPIRFGATVATIERLMELPCNEKTENACYYPIHAVDFYLTDGVLSKIHIHGQERPFKNDGSGYMYGIFNGKLLNDVELGMYREFVEERMGPPKRGRDVELGSAERGFQTVFVAEYPGITLEYDKLRNGNTVLAGIVLTKSETKNAPPVQSAKPRPKPPLH